MGVSGAGPTVAAFFANFIPLFTAILSAAMLGEPPQLFHGLAFALIVAGIWVSSKTTSPKGNAA
jgi:drug/metabolite transporter (DMT)-like permease